MCEKTEDSYLDGEVVWVKLGSCWWPGEVVSQEKLPPDVLPSFRKPPIAVVKFFQEDTYEYVKNGNSIFKYDCARKNEFINKGLHMFRTKQGHMEKFPEDVIRAETAVGGDIEILTRDEFQEKKKESYAGIFGDPKKTPASGKKGKGRGRPSELSRTLTPFGKAKEKVDYKVHILVQGSKTPGVDNTPANTSAEVTATPSTSAEPATGKQDEIPQDKEENTEETNKEDNKEKPLPTVSTLTSSGSGIYSCHACSFTTMRLNVLILHNKTHSVSFTPYTPSPVRKKVTTKASKPSSDINKTPKVRRQKAPKEKSEKAVKKTPPVNKKRAAEPEVNNAEPKKVKTDEEIKSSLLADWDDDDADDLSNDESSTMAIARSPEIPEAAESPAVPTSAEQSSVQMLPELSSPTEKKSDGSPTSEKPEASSDSKYEFCEDEDWPVEADGGRKIPRVKNPKRKEDTKSVSLDEDEVAREVAELLNKTTMPDLPSAPEPLKVEENFPEPSIVKSPDKEEKSPENSDKTTVETPPTKAIFKTKTFFRSRHSRSQDAIGKYVAEQLNANSVDRMDVIESELNGSEVVSSPEARDSPPIEHVKVARLAPKIQLKKMKAELREKEKSNYEHYRDIADLSPFGDILNPKPISPQLDTTTNTNIMIQDVLYPTQEIKPVNTDLTDPVKTINRTDITDNRTENAKLKCASDQTDFLQVSTTVTDNIEGTINDSETMESTELLGTNVQYSPLQNKGIEYGLQDTENTDGSVHHTVDVTNKIDSFINHTGNIAADFKDKLNDEEVSSKLATNKLECPMDTSDNNVVTEGNKIEHLDTTMNDNQKVVDEKMETNQDLVGEIENSEPVVKFPSTSLQKSYEPYMNESTASAVDALLSVSREADRVTRIISDDPPEDLFEDDNKDNSGTCDDINGFNENINLESNGDIETVQQSENIYEETVELQEDLSKVTSKEQSEIIDNVSVEENVVTSQSNETNILIDNQEEIIENVEDVATENVTDNRIENVSNNVMENIPSESDLQIAETLINLPSTAIQNKTPTSHQNDKLNFSFGDEMIQEEIITQPSENIILEDNNEQLVPEQESNIHQSKSLLLPNTDNIIRFETEQEKSENLNAAQSLVEMSESIDHKINIDQCLSSSVNNNKDSSDKSVFSVKQNNGLDSINTVEQKSTILAIDNGNDNTTSRNVKLDASSSKLLKILEEPCVPKFATNRSIPTTKQSIITGKEKILNFDVAKSSFKGKSDSPKQKIIIRRSTPHKNIINTMTNIGEMTTPDKIILSRSNNPAQDGAVQTYTIQTTPEAPSDASTIIIQQKIRKIAKPPTSAKVQKIKSSNSLIPSVSETSKIINDTPTDDNMFDINSMPIVLSEDLLTPENIEKMPVVMSDGNIITHTPNPPKLVKTKQIVETEKVAISASPHKTESKTLLMNPVSEVSKVPNTPNILSKSSKLRGAKPMLVIDKTTGKQKIIMAKGETTVKEMKQAPALIQSVPQNTGKAEKFIILPSPSSPRPGRTQKIVIDPQTGKAHVLVAKGSEPIAATESKPVSAKLVPSSSDASTPGNTVMIITNAQGAQSRIVLTPEHEKMLFPKKQQSNVTQLKTIAHRISTNTAASHKSVVTSIAPAKPQNVTPVKSQTRIVSKQKSAIITSKGQLIVGGRVATTAQNIVPMPEIRQAPKRIIASEPKKLVQTIQKTSSEPLIFLQQKSGAVMQLTAAQFEHLQRTGQIVQKTVNPVPENKVVIQKTLTISPNDSGAPTTTVHKPRVRKTVTASPTPAKKLKQEPVPIAPAPAALSPAMPALAPLSNNNTPTLVPSASNTISVATTNTYSEFDNFEELLPSTAIVRQQPEPQQVVAPVPQPAVAQPDQVAAPPPAQLTENQLLAVPGEHFGGPIGSFYLCMEENGTLRPIDNRPLVLEDNQLVPMTVEPVSVLATQPERRDILEAALANSDVFHADTPRDEAPDFRDLNANVSVHCRVSETSTTLNQPIMTPVEVPSKVDSETTTVASNLEDGLAVIGVTPPTVPTSLELPITVTDPRIAPVKTTDPLSNNNYGAATSLLPSPNTEMTYVTTEEVDVPMCGPISMPLLTEEEAVAGKSMPILTDEITERTVSSVDSTIGSPSSIDVRESETEDGSQWSRRLLTPGSDTSETSAEIPLQPAIQLSVSELTRHS